MWQLLLLPQPPRPRKNIASFDDQQGGPPTAVATWSHCTSYTPSSLTFCIRETVGPDSPPFWYPVECVLPKIEAGRAAQHFQSFARQVTGQPGPGGLELRRPEYPATVRLGQTPPTRRPFSGLHTIVLSGPSSSSATTLCRSPKKRR